MQLLKTEKLKTTPPTVPDLCNPGKYLEPREAAISQDTNDAVLKITSVVLYQSLGKQSRKNLITLTKNKEQKLVEMQLQTGLRGQQTVSWLNG